MRSLVYHKPGSVSWEERPEPQIQSPQEALVAPKAVAACDLDSALLKGAFPLEGPFDFGHEFVGEVIEVGDEVTSYRPGDEVVVSFQISCGDCDRCRRGITGSCLKANPGAMYGLGQIGGDWGGAFSELVRVPFGESMLFRIPDEVEPRELATASDNIVDGYRTVAPALEAYAGAGVLVVGGGGPSIALFAVAAAKALGASSVTYIDSVSRRLELAEQLGADVLDGPPPRKAGRFPITVDASGVPDGLMCAVRSTEPGGVCTSIGIYPYDVPMPLWEMYSRGITFITGRPNSVADLPAVIDLIAKGLIQPSRLTTYARWDELPEALNSDYVKLVVER